MLVIQRWVGLVSAVLLASIRWVQATFHVQAAEQEHSLLPQVLPHTQCVWLALLARFRQLLGLIQTVPVLSAKLASILKFQGLVLRQVASPVILENTRQLWARRRGLRAWTVAPVHIPSHLGVLQQPVVFNALQAHIQHLLLSTCQDCESGQFSGSGSSTCQQCPEGKYSTAWAATSPLTCRACYQTQMVWS